AAVPAQVGRLGDEVDVAGGAAPAGPLDAHAQVAAGLQHQAGEGGVEGRGTGDGGHPGDVEAVQHVEVGTEGRPGRGEAPGGHSHRRGLEEQLDHRPRWGEAVADVGQPGPEVTRFEHGQADRQADVAGRAELVVDVA